MTNEDREVDKGGLLAAVEAVVISPGSAKALVAGFREEVVGSFPGVDGEQLQDLVAERIVSRYTLLAATSGAVTSLPGAVPGVGTVVAVGAGLADATYCMKLQVDMCLCLAEAFGYDVYERQSQQIAYLVAGGALWEKMGGQALVEVASKAGVGLVRSYIKGTALQVTKTLFKRVGGALASRAVERAIPFGVGVVVGAGGNYAITKYTASKAVKWFVIDRANRATSGSH